MFEEYAPVISEKPVMVLNPSIASFFLQDRFRLPHHGVGALERRRVRQQGVDQDVP